MFWIGFTKEPLREARHGEEGLLGLLMLGSHEERFVTHTWTWSQERYVSEWRRALTQALAGKASALITDMRTPAQSSHLIWWPMWRIGNELVFQNQLFFFAKHKLKSTHIDVEHLYDLVGNHKPVNHDGVQVSEWRVAAEDVKSFLDSTSDQLVTTNSQPRVHN